MKKHYVNFPSDHLNCEYIAINAYATSDWKIQITLDGYYYLEELEKIVVIDELPNRRHCSFLR